MDDSPVEEYRNKMTDWGLPLSQYSQQCQACFAPQSGSGLDIVENTEQGRQANQYRYPRPERRYSVFRNQGTVAPEYSGICKGAIGHKSKELRSRQSGQPAEVIAYADKANTRLRSRYYKMIRHGKKKNVAVAAVARELACFIWGMMTGNISIRPTAGTSGPAASQG